MFTKMLRENKLAAAVLTFLRVYLGYQWITAGWGKVTGGFDATGFMQGAIGKATGDHPAVQGWWASFLKNVAVPNGELFSFLVAWGELLVGIALILGLFTTIATLMGITMNFAFLFSGTTSTNPQMVLIAIFILVAGFNAGKYGLDRWVIPFIRKQMNHKKEIDNKKLELEYK
ncbi:DoxX family membrane protein [Pontibacillus yanchengensis]|uniref:DoxX family membrane protein n=2 Tax=Pontibacillus yanchengensis TaxID=462910 RepID=A0ACC7VBD0_9BACI|nr:DoxX family protein [Pontibacillus yanchengensis]MYL34788.1 DoxX family membrane protein [Pontibacillus yanchengensis]MYL52226.1 DoxX family membrane protein [Pontibacillus yanchengensis]